MDGPFSQQLSIMHSLSSREDLLSPHEHVVRIGVFLVGKKKKKKANYILTSQPQNIKLQIQKKNFQKQTLNRSSQTGHRSNIDVYLMLRLFIFIINEGYIQINSWWAPLLQSLFSGLFRSSSTRPQLEPFVKIFVMVHFRLCHCYIYVWLKRTYGVVWIGHCVERSNSQWIFIQDIEVGIILQNKQNCQWHPDYNKVTPLIISAGKTFLFESFCYCVLHKYTSRSKKIWKTTKRGKKKSDCDLDGVRQYIMYSLWRL